MAAMTVELSERDARLIVCSLGCLSAELRERVRKATANCADAIIGWTAAEVDALAERLSVATEGGDDC
jgi:hypothetical protein